MILSEAAADPWERWPQGSLRLLPPPGEDSDLAEDWEDYVRPEIREDLHRARSVVVSDLGSMAHDQGNEWSLIIPSVHVDDWLITLNAMRLSMATEHGFTEADMEAEAASAEHSAPKALALMQVHLLGFMQECLIRSLGET